MSIRQLFLLGIAVDGNVAGASNRLLYRLIMETAPRNYSGRRRCNEAWTV